MNCPCGNSIAYESCCALIHQDLKHAKSAEALMRARYTAFVKHDIDFIYDTFHPSTRPYQNKIEIAQWAIDSKWMQLEILNSSQSTVEFKAYYLDSTLQPYVHHEKSTFQKHQGLWYYVDGKLFTS